MVSEHRRKGAQGAILAARIRAAGEAGLDALATETGERIPDRPGTRTETSAGPALRAVGVHELPVPT
jgi:hypothetical protein